MNSSNGKSNYEVLSPWAEADPVTPKGLKAPRLDSLEGKKIAINAVIAACLPTYMPVLIAGVQALTDPDTTFGIWGVSTGSWAPFWIINGPQGMDSQKPKKQITKL